MRKPKFIRRILDWCIKLKSNLPLSGNKIPLEQKFPILRLPFLAQKHVLLMLNLRDLIPLSFLSKRSKRMIKYALPSKKAHYDFTVWSGKYSVIDISSRFGSYTAFAPNLDHIIDLLGYPSIRVVVDSKSVVTEVVEWIKTHQHCVKKVLFLAPKMASEVVNPFIEPIGQLNRNMSIIRSEEELQIENPDISLIHSIWYLKCRTLRLTSKRSSLILLANFILFDWTSGTNYKLSMIEQLIFELRECNEVEWKPVNPGEKSEEDLEHPIYGTINEWYRLHGFKEKKEAILFKTHHNGNQVMVLNIQRIFGLLER